MVLVLLSIVNSVLIIYLLLLSIRIVLAWFSVMGSGASMPRVSGGGSQGLGRPWDLLCRATDPYLGLFYRLRFLRKGIFDFTPIAAILVLVVALDLVNGLLSYGRITLGFFLASVFQAAWSGARFLLLLFLVIGLLRVVPILVRSLADAMIWRVVDLIIQPVVAFVMRIIRLGRRSGYTQYLLLTLGLLFVTWLLGELAVRQIVGLLQFLPI